LVTEKEFISAAHVRFVLSEHSCASVLVFEAIFLRGHANIVDVPD
jgi:hypothetical protein